MPRRSSRAVPASTTKRRASDRLSAQLSHAKKPKHSPPTAPAAPTANPESVRTTAKRSKYFEQGEATEESRSRSNEEAASEDGFVSAAEDSLKDTASPTRESKEPKEPNATAAERKEQKKQKKQKKSQGSKEEEGKKRDSPHPESHDGDEPTEPGKDVAASLKGKELWREGVKTGLGPGKEVFIQKPKARDPGDVPYEDHTLHPNTMLFLQDLEENNDRQWLKAHDPDFRAAKKDWETFVESLSEKIIDKDSTIPELPAKDLVFRIHRDVRFSKNPTPYKPGSCFVGSGLWSPEADALALLREDIDHNSPRLKAVLKEPAMRREIFNGMPDGDDEAVKAFVEQNKESALKIKPKGYDVDNDNIQLLRLRSFTIGTPLSDSELLGPKVQERVAALIGIMEPFVTYLNSVVMPDPVSLEPSSGSESANGSE